MNNSYNVYIDAMEKNRCVQCGAENDAGLKYCKACGFTLPRLEPERRRNTVPLRPNKDRAQMAVIWLWIFLLLQIPATFISGLWSQISYVIIYSEHIPLAAITATMLAQLLLGFLVITVSIFSMITFLMWFHRAYYNLRQLKGQGLLYRTGWATGAWFVPILHLYRPYRMMNELFRESKRILEERGNTVKLPRNISIWWWLSIFISVLPTMPLVVATSLQLSFPPALATGLQGAQWGLQLVNWFLTVKIIRNYSKIERLLSE